MERQTSLGVLENAQRLGAAESATFARDVEIGTATAMVLAAEGSISRKAVDNPFLSSISLTLVSPRQRAKEG
jgi:hypothetical protein